MKRFDYNARSVIERALARPEGRGQDSPSNPVRSAIICETSRQQSGHLQGDFFESEILYQRRVEAKLIHMNGRVYGYNLGRFMSVDPLIHSEAGSQGINPYSYIFNNPLSGTDPSGYDANVETTMEFNVDDIANITLDKGGNVTVNLENGASVSFFDVSSVSATSSGGATATFDKGSQAGIAKKGALGQNIAKRSQAKHSKSQREDVQLTGYETACLMCVGPAIPGSSVLGAGAASNNVGDQHTENIANGLEKLAEGVSELAEGMALMAGGGSPTPDPDDQDEALQKIREPNSRHYFNRINMKSTPKEQNTVIMPNVNVQADLQAIRQGQAVRSGNNFAVNGRVYGLKQNGTLFPKSGNGFYTLSRGEYKALGVYNKFGNTARSAQILRSMNISRPEREYAQTVWRLGKN